MSTNLRNKISKLQTQKVQYWAQRAKNNWVRFGDVNTRSSMPLCPIDSRKFHPYGIKTSNDNWEIDPTRITQVFFEFFSTQSKTNSFNLKPFINIKTLSLSLDDHVHLLKPVTDSETWEAVKSIGPNKAPGPDWLNADAGKF